MDGFSESVTGHLESRPAGFSVNLAVQMDSVIPKDLTTKCPQLFSVGFDFFF